MKAIMLCWQTAVTAMLTTHVVLTILVALKLNCIKALLCLG